MSWRDFKTPTPIDNIDKRDKSTQTELQAPPFVPFVAFVDKDKKQNKSATSLIEWYLSIKSTLDPTDDLHGYRNSKLSEPTELVDMILKEAPNHWMRINGDLEHCIQVIKRHVENKTKARVV